MAGLLTSPSGKALLALAVVTTCMAAANAQEGAPYCNWDGCNGEAQGGSWCNQSRNRCEARCGGAWCEPGSEPPPPSGGLGYCNWDGCNGEVHGGDWCNESEGNCVNCGNGAQWCSSSPTPPGPVTASPTPAPTTSSPTPPPATNSPTPAPATPSPTDRQPPVPTSAPPTDGGDGYCNWNDCNGEVQGGDYCNESEGNCIGCGNGARWCSSSPTPSTPPSSPSPTSSPPPNGGSGTLQATHFWDCSGAACDARTLQPWDPSKYRYSANYAPLDPADYGGAVYGERMWMTGAASDILSAMMGPDDSCCGQDSEDIGGCGKCLLVSNPSAVNSHWTAVVMKKNRCPPWSAGCDQAHFDLAVPGYDNLQFSTANICGQSDTIISQAASSACGDWYLRGSNTIQGCSCSALPSSTPAETMIKAGCEMFTAWGWTSGNPVLDFEVVECPAQFKAIITDSFGPSGPTDL